MFNRIQLRRPHLQRARGARLTAEVEVIFVDGHNMLAIGLHIARPEGRLYGSRHRIPCEQRKQQGILRESGHASRLRPSRRLIGQHFETLAADFPARRATGIFRRPNSELIRLSREEPSACGTSGDSVSPTRFRWGVPAERAIHAR
jgi:hypothetical protein